MSKMTDGRVSRSELSEMVRKVHGVNDKRLPKLRKELDWVGYHLYGFIKLVDQSLRMEEITEEEAEMWKKEAKDISYRLSGLEYELLDDEIKEGVKGYMEDVRKRKVPAKWR